MANTKNFIAKNGFSTGDGYSMPDVRPSLLLDFANSKTLDPRITFTRGSTATYWDGHTTAKAEENLITYSQELRDATYTNGGVVFTENDTTAPDGTTTADKVTFTSQTTSRFYKIIPNSTGGYLTFSFYAKYVDKQWISVRISESAAGTPGIYLRTWFDLNNGVVGTDETNDATITSVGNGWYRCTVTSQHQVANDAFLIRGAAADNATSNVAAAGDVYFWGLQAEQRSSATAYTATTSSPIVKYQPTLQTAASGEARFDHDPVTGESKGLLIEESRTNNLTYSEQIDNSDWTKSGAYVTANTMIAPDGTQTADKLSENTANSSHDLRQAFTGSSSTTYTYSFYAKAGERSEITFFAALSSGSAGGSFNLATGVASSAYMYPVGNGWYRCYVPVTTASSGGALNMILILNNGSASSYTGDGYSGIYFWGLQLEQGSFRTSYIATSGSTVTRSTDVFNMPLSGIYSSGPVTMYYEGAEFDVADYSRMVLLSDGTNNNRLQITTNDSSAVVQAYVVTNGIIEGAADLSYNVIPNQFYKAASAFATGDNAVSAGGLTPATNSPDTLPQVTNLYLGSLHGSDADKGGWFKKVALYPQRLSNATLQAMTEE